jgi:hypothetical protein
MSANSLLASTLELSPAKAAEWSLGGSIAISFSKTRASGYGAALHAARQAAQYAEGKLEAQFVHVAGFGISQQQLALAIFVIRELRSSKSLQIFAGGKFLQDKWHIEGVLECVLSANSCSDPHAHCVVIVEEDRLSSRPYVPHPINININFSSEPPIHDRFGLYKVGMREFPCRLLYERGFKFQEDHPSGEDAQIEAAAVRQGCDWCPHLRFKNRLSIIR